MLKINKPRKRIIVNAVSSSLQVLITGCAYFILYKQLATAVGVKQLGVWSLVLSTSSIGNLANFGITSGLVKFVAEYEVSANISQLRKLLFTAAVAITGFFLLLVVVAYLSAKFIISRVVEPHYVTLALNILPYSLFSLVVNGISGVFTSTLEGFQKNYLRNFIYIISTVFFLAASLLLLPKYKLYALAYAQVIQSILILIISYFYTFKLTRSVIFDGWNWDSHAFKRLLSFGSKFQLISVLQILYEPLTKSILTNYGGLAIVGYYEMGSRLVSQVRGLIVSANQVMIPIVSQAKHKEGVEGSNVKSLYMNTFSVTLYISSIVVSLLLIFTPYISYFWIGRVDRFFIESVSILSMCTFFNLLCGPAYFSSMGEGKLNSILLVHVLIAVLNLGLGIILGHFWGGVGVIWSWSISFSIGSVLLIHLYQKTLNLKFSRVLKSSDLFLFFIAAGFVGLVMSFTSSDFIHQKVFVAFIVTGLSSLMFLVVTVFIKADLLKLLTKNS